MQNITSLEAKDQATGLRHLFAGQPLVSALPVHVVSCPERPALTLPLLSRLAHDLGVRGHTAMWVDEVRLNAREGWPLPCRVRFDLSKALLGHEPLVHAVASLQPSLWYALAQQVAVLSADLPPLSQRLQNSGVSFDVLMVSAGLQGPASLRAYGPQVHHTVISGCDAAALKGALAWMQLAEDAGAAQSWSMVLAGRGARLAQASKWVEATASRQLQTPVHLLGTVDLKLGSVGMDSAWAGHLDLLELLLQQLLSIGR